MKQLILIGCIIILTAFFGINLARDPGYILIIFNHWQIETTLILACFLITCLCLGIFFAIRLFMACIEVPFSIFRKFREWRQYRAEQGLNRGLKAFYQGQWKEALTKLRTEHAKTHWSTDLMAAEAAQKNGALAQRDILIHHALDNEPSAKESILIFQAKLQIEQGQFEQAQATLKKIAHEYPHPSYQWLQLQLQIHTYFKEYESGLKLIECQKKLFRNEQEYLDMFKKFLVPVLENAMDNQVLEVFRRAPKSLQIQPQILKMMVPDFIEERFIRQLIEKRLSQDASADILEVIAKIPPSNFWLKKLEKVREEQPNNAMLYYVFGKIQAGLKLWGSAIKDLQKSIALQPSFQAYTQLAQIYMDLEQHSNALAALQQAIRCQD